MGNREDAARQRHQLPQGLDERPPGRSSIEHPTLAEDAERVISEVRAEISRSVRKAFQSPGE